jgi:hypothetical protein
MLGKVNKETVMDDEQVVRLLRENDRLRRTLLRCREEFCWHGNTGKSLSKDSYGGLVDMIDAAIYCQED